MIEFINSLNFYSDNLVILNLEADEKYASRKIKRFEESKKKDDEEREMLENFNIVLKEDMARSIQLKM